MIEVIIILASLLLAGGAAYGFLYWKAPTRKERFSLISEKFEQSEKNDLSKLELEEATSFKIKETKKKLNQLTSEAKKLTKKKEEDCTEKEKELLEHYPDLEEMQTLIKDVQKKEDLDKKFYSGWNLIFAAGIGLGTFAFSWWIIKTLTGKAKGEGDN